MASGDTLISFTPLNNEPPSSNYATLDMRGDHPVLDFDAASDETAVFSGVLPRNYDGGGLTVYLHYSMSSTTTDDVVWNAQFERIGDGQANLDTPSFAAVQTVTDTVPGTSGLVTITSIAFTEGAQMDSLAVGEGFRLNIIRDADDLADDAAGDAELRFVEIKES